MMVGVKKRMKSVKSERDDAKRSKGRDKVRLCERWFVKVGEGW